MNKHFRAMPCKKGDSSTTLDMTKTTLGMTSVGWLMINLGTIKGTEFLQSLLDL
jgi:hypothetical protein